MTCPSAWHSSSFVPETNLLDNGLSDDEIAVLNEQGNIRIGKNDLVDSITLASVDTNGLHDTDAESIDVDQVFEEGEGDPLLHSFRRDRDD